MVNTQLFVNFLQVNYFYISICLLLDPFLPRPDNLLVNLKECKELVKDLLNQLPNRFAETHDPGSALGAALQVAFKLMVSVLAKRRYLRNKTCYFNKHLILASFWRSYNSVSNVPSQQRSWRFRAS